MNKLIVLFITALSVMLTGALYAADVEDITDGSPYYYQATIGTQVGPDTQVESQTDPRIMGNPFGLTPGDSDSGIYHLPVYHGNMNTNQHYRFLTVAEQVFTVLGEGKHGMWRLQENGTVRLYITDEAEAAGLGIPASAAAGFNLRSPNEAHAFALTLSAADIGDNYTAFDPSASFGAPDAGGYKSFGGFNGAGNPPVNTDDNLVFLDVPIFHEFFEGKYDDHVPIDLANYYCTMSGDEINPGGARMGFDYEHARSLMDFVYSQPAAGKVGPLGKRAGLDVTENWPKIIRMDTFGDARIWANVNKRDDILWREIDTNKTMAEIYLVERPFFNEEFLFIIIVFDDKPKKGRHSYVRPAGPYFEHLKSRGLRNTFKTKIIEQPGFWTIRTNKKGKKVSGGLRKMEGTRLFGVHHPGTPGFVKNEAGSGCPSVGGDFGEDTYAGAWPNNYQEITPLCDGIVIDLKLYANLDDDDNLSWRDENKNLPNNTGSRNGDGSTVASGENFKNYIIDNTVQPARDPGHYGEFTDPYLTDVLGISNRDEFFADGVDIPHVVKYPSANDQVTCNAHEDVDGNVIDSCPNSPSSP